MSHTDLLEKFFLRKITKREKTILLYKSVDKEIFNVLIKKIKKITHDPEYPILHLLCERESSNLVELSLSKFSHPDLFNNHNETPLYICLRKKNLKLASLLLKKGADINLTFGNEKNSYLIEFSKKENNYDIIKFLLENNIFVNHKNIADHTALMLSCTYNRCCSKDIFLLLKFGAEVNLISEKKNSALHVICNHRKIYLIDFFYRFGSNLMLKNEKNDTAMDIARNSNFLIDFMRIIIQDILDYISIFRNLGIQIMTKVITQIFPIKNINFLINISKSSRLIYGVLDIKSSYLICEEMK